MADDVRLERLELELADLRKRVDAIDARTSLRLVKGGHGGGASKSGPGRSPVASMLAGASMRSKSKGMPTHEEICRQLEHPTDKLGYSLGLAAAAALARDQRVRAAAYVIGETSLMIEERTKNK